MDWFTSDIHRSHKNIIKYSNRPFKDVEEMNYHILRSWDRIQDNDTLWSLGDFSFEDIDKTINFLEQANTRRFKLNMILGNHDQHISKNRQRLLDTGLVQNISSYEECNINGQFIVMFHYPLQQWNKCHHGAWALHGHCHGSVKPLGKQVDVGLDAPFILNEKVYRPYNFNEIKRFMEKQSIIGHH